MGSGISPFNAWLLLRGLRTLPARLERIGTTTATVLSFLEQHPKVATTIFPLSAGFPQYALAKRQMSGACGLITFTLKQGTVDRITRFCETLQHFLMAVSWGGYESLILPKCAGIAPADFNAGNEAHQMIRMYIGLEESGYLIKDLEQALATI